MKRGASNCHDVVPPPEGAEGSGVVYPPLVQGFEVPAPSVPPLVPQAAHPDALDQLDISGEHLQLGAVGSDGVVPPHAVGSASRLGAAPPVEGFEVPLPSVPPVMAQAARRGVVGQDMYLPVVE